jgi:hypothetical protein
MLSYSFICCHPYCRELKTPIHWLSLPFTTYWTSDMVTPLLLGLLSTLVSSNLITYDSNNRITTLSTNNCSTLFEIQYGSTQYSSPYFNISVQENNVITVEQNGTIYKYVFNGYDFNSGMVYCCNSTLIALTYVDNSLISIKSLSGQLLYTVYSAKYVCGQNDAFYINVSDADIIPQTNVAAAIGVYKTIVREPHNNSPNTVFIIVLSILLPICCFFVCFCESLCRRSSPQKGLRTRTPCDKCVDTVCCIL